MYCGNCHQVPFDSLDPLRRLAAATSIPLCASETLSTAGRFADLLHLEPPAVHHLMFDLSWLGGITVAKSVAALADAHSLPTSTHAQGPVQFAASAAVASHCASCECVELVRSSYYGYYQAVVDVLPPIINGFVSPLPKPGLGVRLRPEFVGSDDVTVKRSQL